LLRYYQLEGVAADAALLRRIVEGLDLAERSTWIAAPRLQAAW
jgi:hypothetical protein